MNRRGFLKIAAVAPIAAVAAPAAAAAVMRGGGLAAGLGAGVPGTQIPMGGYAHNYIPGDLETASASPSVLGGSVLTPAGEALRQRAEYSKMRLVQAREEVAALEVSLGIAPDDYDGDSA